MSAGAICSCPSPSSRRFPWLMVASCSRWRTARTWISRIRPVSPCIVSVMGSTFARSGFGSRGARRTRCSFGPEVPVVQITVANGAMTGALDVRVRRYTQPFVRPHIDVRVTDEGRSGWRDWVEGAPSAQQELGLELDVDTSEAGFLRTPFYFGVLQGDFSQGQDPPLFEADPWPQGVATLPLEAMGFIATANVGELYVSHPERPRSAFPEERVGCGSRASWLAYRLVRPRTGEGLRADGGCFENLYVVGLSSVCADGRHVRARGGITAWPKKRRFPRSSAARSSTGSG